MSTFVLWDIDGTLIQNTPTAGTLYLEAIEHVTGVRPTVPVENPHGMTEGQLLTAILVANGMNPARLGEVLFDLDVISREQYERGQARDLCDGVEAALAAVAERGWTNALLTGNGPNRARFKLLAAGLDPEIFDWDHSYFGHESPTRHHLTAGARDALGENSALIVGDTPNDGLAADSAGIPFLAVATGVYSREQLAATNAVVVLDDLASGLDELLEAIGSAAGDGDGTSPEGAVDTTGEPESSIAPGPSVEPPIVPGPSPEPSIVPEPEPSIEPSPEPGPPIEPAPEPGPLIEPSEPGPLTEPAPEPSPDPSMDREHPAAPEPLIEPPPRPARSAMPTGLDADNRDENSDTGEFHRV